MREWIGYFSSEDTIELVCCNVNVSSIRQLNGDECLLEPTILSRWLKIIIRNKCMNIVQLEYTINQTYYGTMNFNKVFI